MNKGTLERQKTAGKGRGRNIVFATGTPISNTMCEMYLMQKYLQPGLLKEKGLYHFDAWAANFGDMVTAMELSPEGKGYREKTRFAKFTNLPELVTAFRMVADVQFQQNLPYLKIPKLAGGTYDIVESEPNDEIKDCVDEFVRRADRVRRGSVDSSADNMFIYEKYNHIGRIIDFSIIKSGLKICIIKELSKIRKGEAMRWVYENSLQNVRFLQRGW